MLYLELVAGKSFLYTCGKKPQPVNSTAFLGHGTSGPQGATKVAEAGRRGHAHTVLRGNSEAREIRVETGRVLARL